MSVPTEIMTQIFAWIHPQQVFVLRRVSRRINEVLTSKHFARRNLAIFAQPQFDQFTGRCQRNFSTPTDLEFVFFMAPASFQSVYCETCLGTWRLINWHFYSKSHQKYLLRNPLALHCLKELKKLRTLVLQGLPFLLTSYPATLDTLDLSGTVFGGPFPSDIAALNNLRFLCLVNCKITGALPESLCFLIKLERLNLNFNELDGVIGSWIGNLVNLEYLHFTMNNLEGSIPNEIGGLVQLKYVGMEGNRLSGSIPASFGNLLRLHTVMLGKNQLSGWVPREFALLPELRICHLGGNLDLKCDFENRYGI